VIARARLLLVHDECSLRTRLNDSGYCTDVAENGTGALSLLRTAPYDLVLLDFGTAPMSAAELLERIRQIRPASELPVILLAPLDDFARAPRIGAGPDDYIAKPVTFLVALARIQAQLEMARAGRELQRATALFRLAGQVRTEAEESRATGERCNIPW